MLTTAVVITILSGMAIPSVGHAIRSARAGGAARYVAGRLNLARMQAVVRSTTVAIAFEPDGEWYRLQPYQDGNGNGIRQADVARLIDPAIGPSERLDERFPGIGFGVHDGVPLIDGEAGGEGASPIRIGRSRFLSFSPFGSATSGTVYLRGPGPQQFAVRVFGATGRVRVLRYDFSARQWALR